ncbi:MAG: DUF4349 domain-containing protein [Clostridia bacterium]|nr:DUF4349 domain-containing protein [Clostridia bacterium]
MNRVKIFLLTLLAIVLCFSACACGAVAEADRAEIGNASDVYYDYGLMEDGSYETPVKTETPADVDPSAYAEKIIHNATLFAESREFDRALSELRASAAALGGYEQSVNVTSQAMNSTNVTAEYYDMEARIRVLETERAAYEEMLKQSDDVSYLLAIKDRLYNVIEEIESYKTQLRVYDNKVSYSTVTLTLDEVITYTQVPSPKETFGARIGRAFRESWQNFADGFQRFTVNLVSAIPTLLVLAAIGGGATAILLPRIRRAKQKKNEASAPDEPRE